MHQLTKYCWSLLLCSLFTAKVSATSLNQKFQDLIVQNLPNAQVGVMVQEANTGQVIAALRSNENFYPASNTKLFTAVAALKFLGPNFQFQTSFHALHDKVKDNILEDNLYVIFRGDPSLSVKDFSLLIKTLKDKGIHQINGNVVIDDTAFEDPAYAPGWTWDSLPWYYSAPITSIILNENKVRLNFRKPNAIYEAIKIEQEESTPPLKLQTKVISVFAEEAEHQCQINAKVAGNQIQLDGCWAFDKTPTTVEIALDDPRSLLITLLKSFFHEHGILFNGKILFQQAPKNVPAILIKRSPPLKHLIIKVLADSNNVYTESLTKALGLAYSAKGSFQAGTNAIQEILSNDTHIEFSQMRLSDGSGQSRYNLASPFLISQLLYFMYHDPLFPTFYAALSANGKTGSLAPRMKTKELIGKVIGKTGSATGTSALSGYITANSGKEYIFSVLINQSYKDYNAMKNFEDKLCQFLIEEPWLSKAASSSVAPKIASRK